MNNKELLTIYKTFIGCKRENSEIIINTLLAKSLNEIDKNPNEPYINANRVRIGTYMAGQDGEMYVCKERNNSTHYWYLYE